MGSEKEPQLISVQELENICYKFKESRKMRQLAIMKNVSFGVHDIDKARLWFDIEALDYNTEWSLYIEDAVDLIQKNSIRNIKDLEGRACIVDLDITNNSMKFVGLK